MLPSARRKNFVTVRFKHWCNNAYVSVLYTPLIKPALLTGTGKHKNVPAELLRNVSSTSKIQIEKKKKGNRIQVPKDVITKKITRCYLAAQWMLHISSDTGHQFVLSHSPGKKL